MNSRSLFCVTAFLTLLSALVPTLSVSAQSAQSIQTASPDLTSECRRILHLALDRATLIEDPAIQARMKCLCAEGLARIGDKAEAKTTYLKALPLILKHQEDWHCEIQIRRMARWLAREKDIPQVTKIVAQIKSPVNRTLLLRAIAIEQAETGQFAAALVTAQQQKYREPLSDIYAQIARAQAKAGQKEAAEQTFSQSLKLANAIEDAERKLLMRSEIAVARARAGQFNKALTLADTLRTSKFYEMTVCDIGAAQAEAGHPQEALALLTNVKDASTTGYALLCVAWQYSKQNDIAAALSTADSIHDTHWHLDTLQGIADGLIRKNQFPELRKIIAQEQILAPGLTETNERGLAFLAVAEHQEAIQQHTEAIATLELAQPLLLSLVKTDQAPDLWARLAATQTRLGRLEAAMQTVQMLHSLTTRGWVVQRIAFTRIHTEDTDVVLRWCDSLPTVYEQTESLLGTVNGLLDAKNLQKPKK